MPHRLSITKTPKCYVGGAFIRSESGRVTALHDASGGFFANIPQCTRKDLRNAVEAAAKAGPGWAKRSAFNRGQILYRLAEMMEARAAELLASVGLSAYANQPSGSMSGGQQQRVAVARALAMNPALLLADEPTGNLDSKSADAVFELLRRVSREQGTTVLFVTHNPELATRCDKTIQVVDGRVL